MRLTKIKLAGFKSFVDPTTFYIPSNLVGIVGPNGCGKSNIIDAVRWVMGESSARHLRGESMADVIFNGSSVRKPVGQASIELVFDNSQGKLGGPWAHYNEIAVKRLLTRTGQSNYFLNGTRCRRRDITDIFLGTGLGPRSYAIIEQGMISRVIEAKPEELRIFFEEAAGISKYKERRRETESRIRHTQENLARLSDVREELAKQLQHLQRQARAAEQYRTYKAEERRVKAELLGLRWQALGKEAARHETLIRQQETALEALVAEQRGLEARLASGREQQSISNEAFNQIQARYYQVGSEITRLQQHLAHQHELRRRQDEELRQIEQALNQILGQIDLDGEKLKELEETLTEAEPTMEKARAAETEADKRLALAETAGQDWQMAWEDFNRRAGEPQRLAEVERTRIEHLERQLLQQEHRLERMRLEQGELSDDELAEELTQLQRAEQEAEEGLTLAQEERARVDHAIHELREAQHRLTAELNDIQAQIQATQGRLVSLEILQEDALGRRQDQVVHWLKEHHLEQFPRLAERLEVEPGWEQAVETVLGAHLEAVCVEELNGLAEALDGLEQGQMILFDTSQAGETNEAPGQNLLSKVRAPWPLSSFLAGIRIAADLAEALAFRGGLGDRETLITPQGIWLGRDWLRITRKAENTGGILVREREIQALNALLSRNNSTLEGVRENLERIRTQRHHREQSRDAIEEEINQGHREHARIQEQIKALDARSRQILTRRGAILEECRELEYQVEQDQEALQEGRMRLEEALLAMEQLAGERESLEGQRESLRRELEHCRTRAATLRQDFRQQALKVESLRTEIASTHQAIERLETQRIQLGSRRTRLLEGLIEETEPAIRERLEGLFKQRVGTEAELMKARQAVEGLDAELKEFEQGRTTCERQIQELRQTLESQRLGLNEIRVRQQTLLDQLRELGVELTPVLDSLPDKAEEALWLEQLEKLDKRIQRLGSINLAAIDEFAQLSERKHYLDAQHNDLVEALTTLENAIRKIDRETRSRLRNTFDQVNEGLERLFPRLFGGGQAYLELTGEDVLDAGVAIMARPPGKRIGNIHLLSGGEKALTAVALVFAIFQLNPAPFCMLDEVDAPLDEANVGRFGELLREMSEQIQFIFITHNKITMEIARHLSGVTMHEPGVSRLVAVDVDEAVRLAAV